MSRLNPAPVLAPVALLLLATASCDGPDARRAAGGPQGELTTVGSTDAGAIQAPNGSMSLAVRPDGAPTLVLSAGFLRRTPVTRVAPPIEVSWSPDSRRFLVNQGAGLRLWTLDRQGAAVENAVVRQAVIQALARRNGCGPLPPAAVEMIGTGWGDDGRTVFVVARGNPEAGSCAFDRAREVSIAVEVETGRLERVGVTAP